MMVINRESEANPTSFMLSEGQSQFGIKLLAVDVAGQRVQIEQSGIKQYLHICSTPNLTLPANGETGAETGNLRVLAEKSVEEFLASEVVQRIKAGDYVWNGRASGGKQISADKQNTGNTGNDGNTGSTGVANNVNSAEIVSSANAQKDYTKEYWYQDCLATEQSRIQYAREVLSGEMTPYPRTPLTPSGTPSQLMDRETIYSSHIPGYRMVGYVD